MPTYDYRCLDNGRVVELTHRMHELVTTWGELCERGGIDIGDTSEEAPVERLATGGQVVSSRSLRNPEAPACGAGACGMGACGTGMCDPN